jgi:sterol desaturase/sphingolipid hydroxylase (fatty acid hydroxylase superfamily)
VSETDLANQIISLQYLALPGGAIVFLVLESSHATGLARPWRQRWWHLLCNIVLWIVSIALFSLSIGPAYLPILPALESLKIGLLYLVDLPFWPMVLLGFLIYDFSDYLFHRLSHEGRWLWLMHATHHSDVALDLSTHVRTHPLHFFAIIFWKALVVAAFGIPYWIVLLRELAAIPVVQLHHSAVRWPELLEKCLGWLIVTPAMHRAHHSPEKRFTDSNYGSLLPWWDMWLGTYSKTDTDHAKAMETTGLDSLTSPFWQSIHGMLLTPWAIRRRADE